MSKGFQELMVGVSHPASTTNYKKLVSKAHQGDKKAVKKMNKLMKAGDRRVEVEISNYQKDLWNKASALPNSTMIHEKDYVPMDCCLCGKHMVSIHDTHNPQPLTEKCFAIDALKKDLPHRCCSECNNTKVMAARFGSIGENSYPLIAIKEGGVKDGWIDPKSIEVIDPKDLTKGKEE